MNLMTDEDILWESKDKRLTLTTHRIRYQKESLGQTKIQSIMLEELASCSMYRTVSPAYLILAVVVLVLGFLASGSSENPIFSVAGVLVGGILIVAYFASRRQILMFASAGAVIRFPTQGMEVESAKQLIDMTEAAKNKRYFFEATR